MARRSGSTSRRHSTDRPARAWSFTLNNPLATDPSRLSRLVSPSPCPAKHFRSIVFGLERGEQTGTPHFQGVFLFKQPVRMAYIRRTLESYAISHCHLEPARSRDALLEYVKKDGRWVCYGESPTTQGQRSDLEDACRHLLQTRDLHEFKLSFPVPFVKFHKGFEKLLLSPPNMSPREPPYVEWIYGPTGTGKTYSVWEREAGKSIWVCSTSLQWFDGYNGQPVVLIDDFRGSYCTFHQLLRYLDRYPLDVPVKGGFVNWSPRRIYITSSKSPREVYNVDEDIQQLLRRITKICYTGEAHQRETDSYF